MATWALVAIDLDAIGARREGAYTPGTLRRAVEFMGVGRVNATMALLAEECGLSVDAWCAETRREMSRARDDPR